MLLNFSYSFAHRIDQTYSCVYFVLMQERAHHAKVRSECVRGPFRTHSASVQNPFGVVWNLFGVHSGSVRDLFRLCSGSVRGRSKFFRGLFGLRSGEKAGVVRPVIEL